MADISLYHWLKFYQKKNNFLNREISVKLEATKERGSSAGSLRERAYSLKRKRVESVFLKIFN